MLKRILWLMATVAVLVACAAVVRVPEGHRPITVADGAPARVTLVGTSLTSASTWPEALEERLSHCGLEVRMVAKPAITSAWGREQLDAIKATEPGLVVIEFAINDADIYTGHLPWASLSIHQQIIKSLGADRVILMTTSPAYEALRRRRPLLPAYFQMYRQIAAYQGTGLADIAPLWRDVPRSALPDRLHPTNESAETVIVPALAPLLGGAFGRTC